MSEFISTLIRSNKTLTVVWVALMVATLVAWGFGELGAGMSQFSMLATTGVIVTAFIKTWLIGFYFMELHEAPGWLKHGFAFWNVVMCGILLVVL